MPLQESLRELVVSRGPGVLVDAAEFRGALDDFLGEEEATTGEVNLLVDAVRLGGLTRLVALLDAGASPQAAVTEAGTALARDRGSDDDRRSRWAVAVLGYAVGRLDAGLVPTHGVDDGGGTGSVAPGADRPSVAGPASPPPPPSGPSSATMPWSAPSTPAGSQPSGTVYAQGAPTPPGPAGGFTPPPPYVPPTTPAGPRRRGIGLVILAIAVVLGLAAGVGVAVWQAQRDDHSASGGGTPSGDSSSSGSAKRIPDNTIILPYRDDAGGLRIYRVNADNGRWSPLTDGTADDLPTISPDRTEFTYLDRSSGLPVLDLRHVGSDEDTQVFPSSGRCEHALRPGWSLDGTRFAIVCTGNDEVTDGIFLCDADGGNARMVLEGGQFRGSPTWVDDDTFVYGQEDPETGADTFSAYQVSTGESTPIVMPDDPSAHVTHADWSPEAGELLFLVHDTDPTYGHLWVADADLQGAHQLGTTEYGHPVWSPDGRRIAALWHAADGSEQLVTIDPADPDDPDVLADHHAQPIGVPTIPVWASR